MWHFIYPTESLDSYFRCRRSRQLFCLNVILYGCRNKGYVNSGQWCISYPPVHAIWVCLYESLNSSRHLWRHLECCFIYGIWYVVQNVHNVFDSVDTDCHGVNLSHQIRSPPEIQSLRYCMHILGNAFQSSEKVYLMKWISGTRHNDNRSREIEK
jgi:hypothetical protein